MKFSENSIWRLTPITLNGFINSPIASLITAFESKFYLTQIPGMDIKSLHKMTWVMQLIPPNHCIGPHKDFVKGRKISFIYYLTDDDWDTNKDGGGLIVNTEENQPRIFEPNFNTLIARPMINNEGPLHYVVRNICYSDDDLHKRVN